jgi:hypothetical protein
MDLGTRRALFFMGCIPARVGIVGLAAHLSHENMRYFAIGLAVISIGFTALFFGNIRLHATEGGGVTWWHETRGLHGFLYGVAAVLAWNRSHWATVPLAMDTALGIALYFQKHNA